MLLCEANVEPEDIPGYCAGRPGGPNDRAHMMFSFLLNPRMWLALARSDAEPMIEGLRSVAVAAGDGSVGDVPAQP